MMLYTKPFHVQGFIVINMVCFCFLCAAFFTVATLNLTRFNSIIYCVSCMRSFKCLL